MVLLLSPFYSHGNQGTDRLSNLHIQKVPAWNEYYQLQLEFEHWSRGSGSEENIKITFGKKVSINKI